MRKCRSRARDLTVGATQVHVMHPIGSRKIKGGLKERFPTRLVSMSLPWSLEEVDEAISFAAIYAHACALATLR